MNKRFTILLIIILIPSSLTAVVAVQASTSSVPEFTLKLVDNSYDVPSSTTTTTDPYTGEQAVTTHPGYHVENRTVEVTIKNQHFPSYSIDNQHTTNLFYNVSYKGHYEDEWTYYPSGSYARDSTAATDIPQSTSDYTVVSFKAPSEGQMDFRVQAQIGYYNESQLLIPVPGAPFSIYTFIGEVSGWSNTQTIKIPKSTSTTTPSTTPPEDMATTPDQIQNSTPQNSTQPDAQTAETKIIFDWIEIATFAVVGVVVALLIIVIALLRRRVQTLERKIGNSVVQFVN